MRYSRGLYKLVLRSLIGAAILLFSIQTGWGQNNGCMEVLPDTLNFQGDLCNGWLYQENIEYQAIYIMAICGDTGLYWEVDPDAAWVGVVPSSGWDSYSVLVWIAKEHLGNLPDSLPPGDTLVLESIITVTAGDPFIPPQDVLVRLHLTCTPHDQLLMVQPPQLVFDMAPGDVLTDSLFVYEAHGDTVLVTWSNSEPWLQLPMLTVLLSTPDHLPLTVITDSLVPGIYEDVIVLTAYQDGSSPPFQTVAVPVTLTITDGEVVLATSPEYFHFTLPPGGTATESLLVYETHGQSIGFWAYNAYNWLHIDTVSAIPLNTPEVLWLEVNTGWMAPGIYSDTVFIWASEADNSPLLVPVTLEVQGGNAYTVETIPSEFHFVMSSGEGFADSLHIFEVNGHSVPFGHSNTQPWLVLDPFSMPPYVTPMTFTVVAGTYNLPPGTYFDTIVIMPLDPDFDFDTVLVPVLVSIYDSPDLVASPNHFEFAVQPGDVIPHQGIAVWEIHGDTMPFAVQVLHGSPWLDIEETSPYDIYWTPDSVFFGIYVGNLAPGAYADTIVLYAPFDSISFPDVVIPVWLWVDSSGYQLVVNPTEFEYAVPSGHSFQDFLHIEELYGATLMLTFSHQEPWLSLPMWFTIPTTPTTLPFSIHTEGMAPGFYQDILVISGYSDNSGPPVDVVHVPFTLVVTEGQPFTVLAAPDHFGYAMHQGTGSFTDHFLVYDLDSANLPFATAMVGNSEWLTLDSSSMYGITPSHVYFQVCIDGLAPGAYGDSILIYYPLDDMYGFDDVLVPVFLQIWSDTLDAVVATEPESFEFVLFQGEGEVHELHVYEIHGGTVPFMMWNQTSWLDFGFCLTMLPTPCTSPFVVNTDSLDPGDYYDTIIIWPDTDGVSFPPVYVPVTLTVLPSGSTPADSLIIPSISVLPCDWECAVQPVQTKLTQPIKGASIPISIPEGVSICSLSTEGLLTAQWDWNFKEVNDSLGYGFVALANSFDALIPPGVSTVFNIYFNVVAGCNDAAYFRWDTTLMLSFSKHLAFTDTTYTTVNPGFDYWRDSVEVTGYTPGSFDDNPEISISDLVGMIEYMFVYGPPPCVIDALDVNGDCIGPDISDLVLLIDYMFMPWNPPPEFPPTLYCGCVSSDGAAVAKLNPEIVVSAVYENGVTDIILSTPIDLRGLQLLLRGDGSNSPEKLVGNELDLVHGVRGENVRIGILDLDGANVIASGETAVIRLTGRVEVVEAVVTDGQYGSMQASVERGGGSLPEEYSLSQNYPNPFNPMTEISFTLPHSSQVTLHVYNVMGQQVAILYSGPCEAGTRSVLWDAREMSSGVYFYRLSTPAFEATRKMVLLK